MKQKTTLTLCVLFCTFSIIAYTQDISPVSIGIANDAEHPCITAQQYVEIEMRCQANRKLLGIEQQTREENFTTLLGWPLQPSPGLTDCSYYHISAYVDQNTAPGATQDFNCGSNTYDGHTGTDISTWPFNFYKMDNDLVEVIAAAPGIILDKHDGEYDRNCTSNNLTANYVIIQHADGSVALYWHMKNGSITTTAIGQPVAGAEYLGVVGSSGSSSGPHLHFEVWSGSTSATRIDPYAGACNTLNASSWWSAQKPYKETEIMRASVHTTDVVIPPCPSTEILNESTVYQIPFQGAGLAPGYAKFYIFIRDEISGLIADLKIVKPDGSTYLGWTYTSASNNKVLMWGFSKLLPVIDGTYTFTGTYNGITCSSYFDIITQTGIGMPDHNSQVSIYPNPSNGKFFLEKASLKDEVFQLYDVLGKKVFQSELVNEKSEITLDLQNGIYSYRVSENNELVFSGKLIIQ